MTKEQQLTKVVDMVLENQKNLALTLKSITTKQYYLTRLFYYSLEVINRTLKHPKNPQNEEELQNLEVAYSTLLK